MSYRAFVLIGLTSIGETAKSGFRISGFIFIGLSFYRAFGIGLSSIWISSIGLSSYTRAAVARGQALHTRLLVAQKCRSTKEGPGQGIQDLPSSRASIIH